jgi:hypothetical protein
MQYIEIGQDIVDAIKGGAEGTGASDAEEAVNFLNGFGEIAKMIATYLKQFYDAIMKWMGK